jgi:hypothetical protein
MKPPVYDGINITVYSFPFFFSMVSPAANCGTCFYGRAAGTGARAKGGLLRSFPPAPAPAAPASFFIFFAEKY